MSYDFSTYIELDGERAYCQSAGNMTWNVNPMYYACLKDLDIDIHSISSWSGLKCSDILPYIEGIIGIMKNDPNRFIAMNPDNNWGSYDGALEWMIAIRRAILLSPEHALVDIS